MNRLIIYNDIFEIFLYLWLFLNTLERQLVNPCPGYANVKEYMTIQHTFVKHVAITFYEFWEGVQNNILNSSASISILEN